MGQRGAQVSGSRQSGAKTSEARKRDLELLARVWSSIGSKAEGLVHGGVRRWMLAIRADMLRKVEEMEADRAAATRSIDEGIIEAILFSPSRFTPVFKAETQKGTDSAIGAALKALNEELAALGLPTIDAPDYGVNGALKMTDAAFQAILERREIRIRRINESMRADVRAALLKSAEEIENLAQLASRIREVMNGMANRGRSMMIARTETGITASASRYLGMKASGVEHGRWIAHENARASHRIYDEQSAAAEAAGEPFPIGTNYAPLAGKGGVLEYPLDERGEADDIINCRCAFVAVIPDPD